MPALDRRAALTLLAAGALTPSLARAQPAPFSFEIVKARARDLARHPYVASPPPPPEVEAVDYEAMHAMGFRRDLIPLWGDDWGIELFPLSRATPKAVAINLVEDGVARPLPYDPDMIWTPDGNPVHALPKDAGFAGFRAISKDLGGEWLVFHGASYFRSPSPFGQYGLSARAIAADTYAVLAEEFPDFREFWLERDAGGRLVIHALLESPGMVGAYRFANDRVDGVLTQEVEASVTFRRGFDQIGFAPLTSMFWYGEDRANPGPDWRPEIHDSDGLAIWTGAGERLWRPLDNPYRVVTSVFSDENPRGFGLIQRDRDFDHYHDEQAHMDRRPSAWVEPLHAWGKGSVRLVEIPTREETDDNIVAFWTPEAPVRAGTTIDLRYRLHWTRDTPPTSPEADLARVVATRSGRPGQPGVRIVAEGRKIDIEFRGENLLPLRSATDVVADVTARNGQIRLLSHFPGARHETGPTALWRITFDVVPDGDQPVDVRAVLRQNGSPLTEIWTALVFQDPAKEPIVASAP
ncbi:glucan biosynthesis protein D [soil metagenome]